MELGDDSDSYNLIIQKEIFWPK